MLITELAKTLKLPKIKPNQTLQTPNCFLRPLSIGERRWMLWRVRPSASVLVLGREVTPQIWHPRGSMSCLFPTRPSGTLEHPHANRSVLPGKAPAAVQLLTPQLAPQGITPSCRSSPSCRELLPFLLAAFSQVRAALNHLAFIHLQVAGKSLAPPPASGDGKTESYLPIQGPLIPGQSPAEKAKRKHAVLLWCVGGWREHAK